MLQRYFFKKQVYLMPPSHTPKKKTTLFTKSRASLILLRCYLNEGTLLTSPIKWKQIPLEQNLFCTLSLWILWAKETFVPLFLGIRRIGEG